MPQKVKQEPPSQRERQETLKNYRLDYSACRMLGHSWPHTRYNVHALPNALAEWHLECENCGCLRVDMIDLRSGAVLNRKYYHPEGYLLKGWGDEAPVRDDWRKSTLKQVMNGSRKLRMVG